MSPELEIPPELSISKIQYALDKANLEHETLESVKERTPEQFCTWCAKCGEKDRTIECAKNISTGIQKILSLDIAKVDANNQEILCDDKDYRETTVAEFVVKMTKHINNPEVGTSMRKHIEKNLAEIQADDGVAALAMRKINLINYQLKLEEEKIQVIADYENEEWDLKTIEIMEILGDDK